jgi:glutamine---fructose-6-phosphate transaminase (isomerizing)
MIQPIREPLSRELLSERAQTLIRNLEERRGRRSLPSFAERVRLSREELWGQPQAIQQTLDEAGAQIREVATALAGKDVRQIYCVGCGDSYFTAISVRYAFEQLLNKPCISMEALEYARYYHLPTDSKTLVIALSSSGVVPRSTEALLRAKEMGALTLGVTNTPDTPFTTEPDHFIHVRARRMGGCPTQASTGAMAAMYLLAIEWARHLGSQNQTEIEQARATLYGLPELVDKLIAQCADETRQLAERLTGRDTFFFVGGGPGLATAELGAAKIKEMSQDRTVVLNLEEYHHYRSLKVGEPLFLVAPKGLGDDRALQTAQDARRVNGILAALVTEGEKAITPLADVSFSFPAMAEMWIPIPYVIPLQLFAIHLGEAKPPAAA